MPITLRHDAIAGLTGAYAAGQASARVRGQKYAMEVLLQQQRHAQRLQEIGLRGGARARAAAPGMGRWDDPLAPQGQLEVDPRTQRAAQRARARKYRLGQDIPAEWQPTFIPQAEIERQQELQDKMRLMEMQHGFINQRATQAQQAAAERAAASQQAIGERAALGREAAAQRAREAAGDREYAEILDDLELGLRVLDPTVKGNIDAKWKKVLEDMPNMDEAQQQEALEKFQNWKRWQVMGGIQSRETTVEEREAEREDAKAREEQFIKDRKDLTSELSDLKKEWRELHSFPEKEPSAEVVKQLEEEIVRVQRELQSLTGGGPPAGDLAGTAGEVGGMAVGGGAAGAGLGPQRVPATSSGTIVPPTPTPVAPVQPPTPTGEQPRPVAPAVDLPQVSSDADYAKLAEGSEFIDAETGKRYKKPYKVKQDGTTFFDLMVR